MAARAWRLLARSACSSAAPSESRRLEYYRHREAYGYFLPIQTRWQDNDQYGHVNNAVYHGYFDTIVNHYLISLASGGAVAGDAFQWEATCPPFVLSSEKSVVPGSLLLDGGLAATRSGLLVRSQCFQGSARGGQLVLSRRWWGVLLAAPSTCSARKVRTACL
ncbi:uncharacterized protein LOC102500751 isoform X2 [Tupaia chinensis]|uniref:uncharacterized protein LOC102500751 isoform X2 n=1 Tax=Tupaia chinensis TaxID=246437 RepID=UPI000FFC430B|nr:uncharacterized protein LOC102500751 isoform X2 [Tupaia chinensis]